MRLLSVGAVGVLLLALLALPAPGAAQAGAFYTVNDIEYYYATGPHGSGHFAVGEGADQVEQDFSGCGWAKLRPDNNKGRIQVLGNWGSVPLTIDLTEFEDANRTPDSIATADMVPGEPFGLDAPIETSMKATANATVRIGPAPILDPVTGAPQFQATWFVTKHGFRDDTTGAITAPVSDRRSGAWEMHLRVGSHPAAGSQDPAAWSHSEPSDGTPYLAPDEAHSRVFAIPNERLFGQATLSVQATSLAPAGSTALEFFVYAPDGSALGGFPMAPGLNGPASQSIEFPLDQVGDYYVEVHGAVSLAEYDLAIEQRGPDAFVLDLWWDDVEPGYAGLEARNQCNEELDAGVMAAYIAPRPPPIAFDWEFSLFTVAAGLTLLVVAVTMAIAAYQWATARRAVQG